MSAAVTPETPNAAPLSLTGAARLAGVSQPTLRKHLKAGRLEATKDPGTYGDTWAIAPDVLAAFVAAQYGRAVDLSDLPPQAPELRTPQDPETHESDAELRRRLDETLVELGKYKALCEASDAADKRVEAIMGARIAELQQDLGAAQTKADEAAAELARLRRRGFFARVFGGNS
jgi:hypothetical protein